MKFLSCDYSFNCIPNAHENRARVARPFLPRAGDAIHPALREREGLDSRLVSLATHWGVWLARLTSTMDKIEWTINILTTIFLCSIVVRVAYFSLNGID